MADIEVKEDQVTSQPLMIENPYFQANEVKVAGS